MSDPVAFTQEDVAVRFAVSVGFVVTLGTYSGPINRHHIASAIAAQLEVMHEDDLRRAIDSVAIIGIALDDGTELVTA